MNGIVRPTTAQLQAATTAMLARKPPQTQTGGTPPGQSESMKLIPIDKIYPYEGNPRKISNDKFLEIKESIRSKGLKTPFFVTRREQDVQNDVFVQSRGGATRLSALKALVEEARAAGETSAFERVMCILEPYTDEANLRANHLIENFHRSDMSFWDSAVGMMDLKQELEKSLGKVLSSRDLESASKSVGVNISYVTLTGYFFATDRLKSLGDFCAQLSGNNIKDTIRPAFLSCERLVAKGGLAGQPPLDEAGFQQAIVEPTLKAYAVTAQQSASGLLDAMALAKELEWATATYLGIDFKQMPAVLASFRADSKATLEDMLPKEARTQKRAEQERAEDDLDESSGGQAAKDLRNQEPAARQQASQTAGFYSQEQMDAATNQAAAIGAATGAAVLAGAGLVGHGNHTQHPELGHTPSLPLVHQADSPTFSLEQLRATVVQAAHRVAQSYRLDHLMIDAPRMPLGFVMELPDVPFDNPSGPSEGWSFLVCVSGLRLRDPLELGQFIAALPNRSDGRELRLMEYMDLLNQNRLDDAESMIGSYPYGENLGLFLWSAMWPSAPLHRELTAIFDALRAFNQVSPTLWKHPMVPLSLPSDEVAEYLGFDQGGA